MRSVESNGMKVSDLGTYTHAHVHAHVPTYSTVLLQILQIAKTHPGNCYTGRPGGTDRTTHTRRVADTLTTFYSLPLVPNPPVVAPLKCLYSTR